MNSPRRIHPVPAFTDNYLWLAQRQGHAVVVDPGDAAPVLAALQHESCVLDAILITHHHPDHVAGISALLAALPAPVPVYGPRLERSRIPEITHELDGSEHLRLLDETIEVLAVPGHTLGHLAYYLPESRPSPLLFCGDTLFSAGCGRLFEGSPQQMFASLQKLANLPDHTLVCCTHEYTASNLRFALAVEPSHAPLLSRAQEVQQRRSEGQPSLPSTLALERQTNPFLRCHVPAVRAAAQLQAGGEALEGDVAVFTALRRWKDGFRG